MLQCYVLTCGRSVTAFWAPPLSQRSGQGPRSPHPKAGPGPDAIYALIDGNFVPHINSMKPCFRIKVLDGPQPYTFKDN
jgi:hypothetical protein